ncbi:MAG: heme o synthase [Gammaproteobacteria bacterium]|nr:heme o synthase [Gammaproteobacteria bacterium]
MLAQIVNIFKLRIGFLIAFTALAGYAVTPGKQLSIIEIALLGLFVLLSSASSGAFNQYVERDLDARMVRTQGRPFVTGEFKHSPLWMWGIMLLLMVAVSLTAWVFNPTAAFHVFMGAFVYAIVYTVWLKRRSVLNIVIGGLAGSFAVLAGAATADPGLAPSAWLLAAVLFLWTPPHFWSLAIALRKDYAAAGVPMLPVVVGDQRAAVIVMLNTLALVAVSLLPLFFDLGLGWIYLTGAAIGGSVFVFKNVQLVRDPTRQTAMGNFFASLIQLTLVLVCAILDVHFLAG